MDGETLTLIFLVGGLLLMLLETVVPGGVSLFLGLSGLFVAALRWFGIMADPATSVLVWLFSSIGLILLMRPLFMKYWGGETSWKPADEDLEAMDQLVEVTQPINAHDSSGRIRFQGSDWQARTLEGKIEAGQKAVIKYRDNVTWIVEPADDYLDDF
ncbi:MAG: NfeD family protein [Balneolaceae bacterium]|nr:NfeD family protein [Balneolaceae bacterium]